MPTSGERKALWFLALVAVSGSVVRLVRPDQPVPDHAPLDRQLRRVDSVRAERPGRAPRGKPSAGRATSPGEPTEPTEPTEPATPATPATPVDLDRADASAIEGLPGIGPTLAARIVAHRDSAGAFGSIEALCDVRGVGPALAKRLGPMVTFSGARRPLSSACGAGSKTPRKARAARDRKRP